LVEHLGRPVIVRMENVFNRIEMLSYHVSFRAGGIIPGALSKCQEGVRSDTEVDSKWLLKRAKDSPRQFWLLNYSAPSFQSQCSTQPGQVQDLQHWCGFGEVQFTIPLWLWEAG
jgi:hypothetical protein